MNKKAFAIAAAVTTLTAGLVAPTAYAGPAWNDYDIVGIPEYLTAPTPFEIAVDGPYPVCSMTFEGTTLTAAPWAFTVTPDNARSRVTVTTCDGDEENVYLWADTAFTFLGSYLTREDDAVTVVNNTDIPSTVVLRDASGNELSATPIPPRETALVTAPAKTKRTQVLNMTATTDDGTYSQTERVVIPHGWDLMSDGPIFDCRTLTWSYNSAGARKTSKTVEKDIQKSLDMLAKETGLTFVQVAPEESADIIYVWEKMGKDGPGGTGGYQTMDGVSSGEVSLNSQSDWLDDKKAGFAPFKPYKKGRYTYTGGPSGRGWLLVHETMHALGFDHVMDKKSIMAPINSGQAKFTQDDLDGLHTLYQCRAA